MCFACCRRKTYSRHLIEIPRIKNPRTLDLSKTYIPRKTLQQDWKNDYVIL